MNETFNDALIECVKACGGSKEVGLALWPTMGVEPAQRKLLACLNPDRHEKLGPDEVLTVLKLAREAGCHAGMSYMASFLHYSEPKPVTPAERAADMDLRIAVALEQVAKLMAQRGTSAPMLKAAA